MENGRSTPPWLQYVLITAGFMLIAAGIIGWGQINRQRDLLSTQQSQSTSSVPRISPADAKGILGQGKAVFVDVRSPESYAEAHIPGSVNIPIDVFETRWKEMDPDQIIILYCT